MTARCALYMRGIKTSGVESLITPTATFPEIVNGAFVPIDPVNAPTKLEVRSVTRS